MKLGVLTAIALSTFTACGSVVDNKQPDAAVAPATPPTGVMATANVDLGARITWTAPAGATPTGYTIAASPDGGTSVVAGTQAVVTGLTAAQSYTFTVTATYANGMATSEPSNSVTVVAGPAAPSRVLACGAATTAIIRAIPTGTPASFNIYYSTDAMVTKLSSMKVSTTTFPYAHTGLTNGTKLYYTVTAVDAMGVESVDSTIDSTTPDAAVHDTVFGSSYSSANQSIEIIDCLSKYANNTQAPPGRIIKGTNAPIVTSNYNALALDAANATLYYRNPTQILVWADATRVSGNAAPTRTISSGSLTSNQGGIALDPMRNILYVGNGGNSILVFTNASTANGSVAPARVITSAAMTGLYGLAIDVANDRLIASNYSNVLVFNAASTLNGAVTPARTITTAGINMSNFGVGIDATNDLLYIGARDAGTISTVSLSAANGAVTPVRSISGINTPMGVFQANNRVLAMSDNNANQIMYWDNANTLTGAVTPTSVRWPTLTATSGFAYAP